jgi:hypothetical protein
MASYTLRARNHHVLVLGGREYRDGDTIAISKAEAERLALGNPAYRFEPKGGGDEVSFAAIDTATAPSPPPAAPEPQAPSKKP